MPRLFQSHNSVVDHLEKVPGLLQGPVPAGFQVWIHQV